MVSFRSFLTEARITGDPYQALAEMLNGEEFKEAMRRVTYYHYDQGKSGGSWSQTSYKVWFPNIIRTARANIDIILNDTTADPAKQRETRSAHMMKFIEGLEYILMDTLDYIEQHFLERDSFVEGVYLKLLPLYRKIAHKPMRTIRGKLFPTAWLIKWVEHKSFRLEEFKKLLKVPELRPLMQSIIWAVMWRGNMTFRVTNSFDFADEDDNQVDVPDWYIFVAGPANIEPDAIPKWREIFQDYGLVPVMPRQHKLLSH